MPRNKFLALPVIVIATLLLVPTRTTAAEFSLFGNWWDTDQLGDALGGGVAVAFPLSPRFDLDLRATYLEELKDDDFNELLDDLIDPNDDEGIFVEESLEIIPVEVGLRYDLVPDESVNFYVGGGVGYYLLSTDFGSIDDEFGYYALLGARFGDDVGPSFFVEGIWRKVEGTIQDLDDLDDVELIDNVAVDLDGLGVNLGVAWNW